MSRAETRFRKHVWEGRFRLSVPGKNLRRPAGSDYEFHTAMLRVCLGRLSGFSLTQTLPAGEPGFGAELIGGTLPEFAAKSTAQLNLGNINALVLRSGHEEVVIPYGKVNSLEYGQNVSRRFVAAVPASPVLLPSKSRKHFVTVGYTQSTNTTIPAKMASSIS